MSVSKTSGTGSAANVSRDGNANDTIRKLQDTYTEREVEQSKKHREELLAVNEAHKDELQKVQDQNERVVRDLKARSEDTITKQDMNYQKEIKDLKDAYTKRMEKLALQSKKATENGTES